jgi:endoglucanase
MKSMKKVLSAIIAAAMLAGVMFAMPVTVTAEPGFRDITAREIVDSIGAGWNLGNTFDAWDSGRNTSAQYGARTITDLETMWVRTAATRQLIDSVKALGFNTIRIPVTWFKATDFDAAVPTYTIRADWMARVKEVVDWAVANDMYIILNTHHDEEIFCLRNTSMAETERALKRIWEQIADVFKDYDEKLIFEGLNEPRVKGRENNEWGGGTPEFRNNLNRLNQVFVDTIRASGGNNPRRVLMVPTYAASGDPTQLSSFMKPRDTVADKLILSIHTYAPFNFAHENREPFTWSTTGSGDSGPAQIITYLNRVRDRARELNMPVILGEWGSVRHNEGPSRVAHAEFYANAARERGMAGVWWDDGGNFRLINRTNGVPFVEPATTGGRPGGDSRLIVDAIMRGAGVTVQNCGNTGCTKPNCDCRVHNSPFLTDGEKIDNPLCLVCNTTDGDGDGDQVFELVHVKLWARNIQSGDNLLSGEPITVNGNGDYEVSINVTGSRRDFAQFAFTDAGFSDPFSHPDIVGGYGTATKAPEGYIGASIEVTSFTVNNNPIVLVEDTTMILGDDPENQDMFRAMVWNAWEASQSLLDIENTDGVSTFTHGWGGSHLRFASDVINITVGFTLSGVKAIDGDINCICEIIRCTCDIGVARVATPTASPNGGTFTGTTNVTLTTATPDAVIYYTTDGSTPSTASSLRYTEPFPISSTTTIRAIAFKEGMAASNMLNVTFTLSSGGSTGGNRGGGGGSGSTATTETAAPPVQQTTGTSNIIVNMPVTVINSISPDIPVTQLRIPAGRTGRTSVSVGADYAGQNAVLVQYNAETRELEFVTAAPVGTDGNANLNITSTGDYLVKTFITGDITGTGEVSTIDALALLRHVAGIAPLNSVQLFVANGKTGDVNTVDALNILRFVAGIIDRI